MPKFGACSRIRKRLVTIWIFPYICFDFRCARETQTLRQQRNVRKNVSSFSLVTLEFSVHNNFKTRMLLEIFDAEFPYKLSYFEPLCLLNKMATKTVKRSI